MKSPAPIFVTDRFPELRRQLLDLLAGLSDEEWMRPTAAARWSVKDIVAHLLQGDIGDLSRWRDGFRPHGRAIHSYADLVELINRLNAEWVETARRISTRTLCELLAFTGPLVEAHYATLDPLAMGGSVDWAGPDPAPIWFDLARQFTERWHHQQQIRDATGRPPLYDPYFMGPVLDAFVRALPHSFRGVAAPAGTVLKLQISGDAGGVWYLHRSDAWELWLEGDAVTEVTIPQDAAWRLFTKGITGGQARSQAIVRGDERLAAQVFATVSVIA